MARLKRIPSQQFADHRPFGRWIAILLSASVVVLCACSAVRTSLDARSPRNEPEAIEDPDPEADEDGAETGSGLPADPAVFGPGIQSTIEAGSLAEGDEICPVASEQPAGCTISEMERMVTEDLAAWLEVPVDSIRVLEARNQTWPGPLLGCFQQKGLVENATPLPGYLIVLGVEDQIFEYHTDQFKTFVRCPQANKPIDPIR